MCNKWFQKGTKSNVFSHRYKTKSTLRDHRRRTHNAHLTETIHKCNICGQEAPNDLALKAHKRHVHFTEKTHKCNICDKTFKVAIVLREHMSIHTGTYNLQKFNLFP